MDEQTLMKHYGESGTQCLKAIKAGQWLGERVRRIRGRLAHAKRPSPRVRARHV